MHGYRGDSEVQLSSYDRLNFSATFPLSISPLTLSELPAWTSMWTYLWYLPAFYQVDAHPALLTIRKRFLNTTLQGEFKLNEKVALSPQNIKNVTDHNLFHDISFWARVSALQLIRWWWSGCGGLISMVVMTTPLGCLRDESTPWPLT